MMNDAVWYVISAYNNPMWFCIVNNIQIKFHLSIFGQISLIEQMAKKKYRVLTRVIRGRAIGVKITWHVGEHVGICGVFDFSLSWPNFI